MEWRKLKIALFSTIYILAFVWLFYFVQLQFSDRLESLGIFPREWKSVANFLVSPFLHGSLEHLVNNSISFLVLSVTCFYFYGGLTLGVILGGICSGFFVWMFGRDSFHLGLSGVCYTLSTFLFFSGIVRRNTSLLTISLLVVFWQTGYVWGLLPSINEPLNISWEGHLSGAFVGFIFSVILRGYGPQLPLHEFEDEDEKDTDMENDAEKTDEMESNEDDLK